MRRALAALLLAAASAGCTSDLRGDPLAGHEGRGVLWAGSASAGIPWPDSFRRGGRFVVENRTGAPVETLFVDLSGNGQPREIVGVEVEDPPGMPARILPAAGYSLRVQLGEPGSLLLPPGGSVRFVLVVEGAPGRECRAVVTIPGVSEPR